MSSSTVTYMSISSNSDLPSWGFHLIFDVEPQSPEAALQSLEQAPPSHIYVPSPEYPKYLAPSDDKIPVEDQPLPADASPTDLSPGYVADSHPLEEDPKEDPQEDLADYPANEGEDEEEESSKDDDDDVEEASKDDKEEEEEKHLAMADFTLPAIDPVPIAEETEPFKTNESARIVEYASAPTPPLPSPLTSYSSLLPQIPSPLILLLSPPLHVLSPPLLLPSIAHRSDIPEADMPSRKRCVLLLPLPEEVNERVTNLAATQRQDAHELYKMAPKKTTTPMIDAGIKELIAQGLADTLADYHANISNGNGNDIHDLRRGKRMIEHTTHECTYSNFLKCQPLNCKGTKGVVGSVMASKLKTMHDAIEFANDRMDQNICTFAKRQAENKRKLDDNSRNNHAQQHPYKRPNVARAYTVGPGEKREYGGSLPLCTKWNYHHNGKCALEEPSRRFRGLSLALRNGEAQARAYAVGNVGTNSDSNVVTGTSFGFHPFQFSYPPRRLPMEEMLYKFIDKGRRKHEEMGAFIREFKTNDELLLKERNNSLNELEFEVYELSKEINNAQSSYYEVKGVTTRGGKTTTKINRDTNNVNKEPLILHHDKPVEPKEVLVEARPHETKEQTIMPSRQSIPFPHRLKKERKNPNNRSS
nr:reverse transcriptase domain-containing protein [Tanacetum cinerariifolium]